MNPAEANVAEKLDRVPLAILKTSFEATLILMLLAAET
jgi:hypothetical protein